MPLILMSYDQKNSGTNSIIPILTFPYRILSLRVIMIMLSLPKNSLGAEMFCTSIESEIRLICNSE
jgi:hypothetical protein